MPSIIPGYEYDIFISYRQKDNKYDGWVTEFVDNLMRELESTFKEDVSVYFDINPHDGLLETHDVDASLQDKLKCLIFIPIISRTYCDPKSFAWGHEFMAFVEEASQDQFGLKIKLTGGNVAGRVLPVRIHDLDRGDIQLCESILGGVLRSVDFIYKEPGVNRPLTPSDEEKRNLNGTRYRNQINKVALAIKEIISGMNNQPAEPDLRQKELFLIEEKPVIREKSIIVLPFENISPDPDQEYFSDGLTEEIITDLSQIRDLLVISRSSAMTFKGSNKKISEIAREVNVRYVLEGSVRKAGNNLRITAQLIDGITDVHVWAEKYSGNLDDVFDIQEKVSQSIVHALKLKLTSEEEHRMTERPIDNFAAFECYLKAQAEVNILTGDAVHGATRYLQSAIDIMGENALLYTGMSFAYLQMVNIGAEQEGFLERAEECAKKALLLDPEFAKAHAMLGWISMWSDPRAANDHFKRARSISPNDILVLQGYAVYLVQECGKIASATRLMERLNQVDPLDFRTMWLNGGIPFYVGEYDEALLAWRPMHQKYPENPVVQFYFASMLAKLDQWDSACSIIDQGARATPDNAFTKIGMLLKCARLKDKDGAFRVMTPEFRNTCRRDCSFSHHLAGIFSLLGEKEEAIGWLENAYERGFINWPLLATKDPWLVSIRGEDRFKLLMEKVRYEWENFEE